MDAEQSPPLEDGPHTEDQPQPAVDIAMESFPFDLPAGDQDLAVTSRPDLSLSSGSEKEAQEYDPPPELFAALTRMLLGSTLQGSELLSGQLREWERSNPYDPEILDAKANETESDRRRYALLGMMINAAESADQGLRTAARVGNSAARWLLAPARLLGNSLPLRPFKKQFDRFAVRGEREWDRWVQQGRAVELRSRKMSQDVVVGTVDEVAGYFSNSEEIQVLIKGQIELLVGNLPSTPEMDELVKALAANYLAYLQQEPEVLQPLVKSQADEYLEFLEENPEAVQSIISGQSVGLFGTIRDEIRERLISIDYVFEKLIRAILRKAPRWELDEPPQAVQERAEFGWMQVETSPSKKRENIQ
jgi:hypothetical protein